MNLVLLLATMLVFHDLQYGPRGDAQGEGETFAGERWVDCEGRAYHTHRSGQFFDAYLPAKPGEMLADAPVMLFLHGGAWCQRYDKDGECRDLIGKLVERGFVVISMDYALQNDIFTEPSAGNRPGASFSDMLRDIDLMVSHLVGYLPSIGVKADRIAIGGASAGAHLSALYAIDDGRREIRGLAHALPIWFVVDIVGPMDLRIDLREPLVGALEGGRAEMELRLFTTLMERLVGEDLHGKYRAGGMAAVDETLKRFSPMALVTAKTPPFILAYNKLHPFASSDGLISTGNCSGMEDALAAAKVRSVSRFCWFRPHGQYNERQLDWIADSALEFAKGSR